MNFLNPMIGVSNMEKSKQFYYEMLDLEIVAHFGANVTLTGGIGLQTEDAWTTFIHKQTSEMIFDGKVAELYFEADDFDGCI